LNTNLTTQDCGCWTTGDGNYVLCAAHLAQAEAEARVWADKRKAGEEKAAARQAALEELAEAACELIPAGMRGEGRFWRAVEAVRPKEESDG